MNATNLYKDCLILFQICIFVLISFWHRKSHGVLSQVVASIVFVFSRYSLNFMVEELKNPNRSASILIGFDIVFENLRQTHYLRQRSCGSNMICLFVCHSVCLLLKIDGITVTRQDWINNTEVLLTCNDTGMKDFFLVGAVPVGRAHYT